MDLIEQKKVKAIEFRRHPWENVRYKALLFLLKKITVKNFIVDVGSGDAFIATQLTKRFASCKIAAVDVNYEDEFVKENSTPNLFFLKSINDVPNIEPVDIILLMDVLEHIERPEELLIELKQLKCVSSSTNFIITVPAFQFLYTEHDVFLKHYRRYNRKQLNKLLCKAGIHISYGGYFFLTLFFARLFQKTFSLKTKQGLHNWKGNRFLSFFMETTLWIDFKFCWYLSRIGINLPGLSCYCVCHPLPS